MSYYSIPIYFRTTLIISVIIYLALFVLYKTDTKTNYEAYSFSPSFSKEEISDPQFDWINMKTKQFTSSQGERSTDILAVNYYSDRKTLNATLWLYFPFKDQPSQYNTVHYGMLIDSDFEKRTGYDGIDYQLEIAWDNNTKTWNKKLEEWSPNGDQRTLDITNNYTGFFEKEKHYVLLSLDLGSLLYPNKYKVTFYAETKDKNNTLITDVTRWVTVPPLELTISTSPTNLMLTPGEQKTIEVKVNSTKGYEPIVDLSALTQDKNNNNLQFAFKKGFNILQVPSYGLATTAMTVSAANNASIAPYTLTIFANSSFPPEQLIPIDKSSSNTPPSSALFPASAEKSQNIVSQSTMAITVQEPISAIEKFSDLWNKIAAPFTFIFGIAADRIAPWIYTRLKTKIKREQQ
jgi:hypothetical protein